MAYTSAICGCEYAGEWQQALKLLERMRSTGVEPNEVTLTAVIGACATATAKIVQQQPQQSSSSSSSSSSSGKGRKKEKAPPKPAPYVKAMQLLKVLRKDPTVVKPNIQVYNAAIRACAEATDVDMALELLDDLRKDGLQPTLVTYGTLMTAAERVASTDVASRIFSFLRDEDGLEPNEVIYGAAISCCRKAGEPERALLLLKKMIKEGLQPNTGVFNTVLMAQSETSASESDYSSSTSSGSKSKKSKNSKPMPQSDSSLLTERDLERCLLVHKLLRSKEYTSAAPNRQTYGILVRTFAFSGQPRQAEKFLREMKDEAGILPDVDLYTATVSAYEKVGQPLQAVRLMEGMRADGYDFYESAVLNALFKRAVKLVNAVGRGLASGEEDDEDADMDGNGGGEDDILGLR